VPPIQLFGEAVSLTRHIESMPPSLALFLWLVILVVLLRFDPAKSSTISVALWVPVIWIFIIGSRLPSQWLSWGMTTVSAALEEGNPVDRTINSALILFAIGILVSRSFNWETFISRNLALAAFLSFALVSVVWSDFPFIAFKRWFRDLGNYLMILVTLSEAHPLEAVRVVLRRLCYLLIPLSVVLVKYFPEISKQYDPWTGIATYGGAATSKNMLGVACLVSGLFLFWDTVTRWSKRKERRTKLILALNIGFIAMVLWLLNLSNSATSRVCLALGCMIIAAAHAKTFQRHPRFLKGLIPTCLCLFLILSFGFDVKGQVAGAVGRDPTLTDRTKIWDVLLHMHTNPLLGTGYESFWLGPRLQEVWSQVGVINEAHNGYLEVYVNLGLIGLLLLIAFLISSYRTICKRLDASYGFGSLQLSMWTILLIYNCTEAAFKGQLMWVVFLLGAIDVPVRRKNGLHTMARARTRNSAKGIPSSALEIKVSGDALEDSRRRISHNWV